VVEVEVDFDGGLDLCFGLWVEGVSFSWSVCFRFLEGPFMISFPNHDEDSVGFASSEGIHLVSSNSSLRAFFPRKARAFFFLLESFSTIAI